MRIVLDKTKSFLGDIYVEVSSDIETGEILVYASIFTGYKSEEVIYENDILEDLGIVGISRFLDDDRKLSHIICDYLQNKYYEDCCDHEYVKSRDHFWDGAEEAYADDHLSFQAS